VTNRTEVVLCDAAAVTGSRLVSIRRLLDTAFRDEFSDDDWAHCLGGTHSLIVHDEHVLAHAAVVARTIIVGSWEFRAGYVEGVGVAPARRGEGLGSAVMTAINEVIRKRFELGVLATGEWHFYERLGWERWLGPSWTLQRGGRRLRTAAEDDGIMVYRTQHSELVDSTSSITCEDRVGDCW
jgi:aminoglycoside 2'-N-acetyltransferase I